MSLLKLDLQVCHSLYSAANTLIRAYRPLLEPLGLTYPQYIVMLSLWEKDGVSVKNLSHHTRLDSGTLTPILKRLQKQGLLERQISEIDERQKRIELTDRGLALKVMAEKIPEIMACSIYKDVQQAIKLKSMCDDLIHLLDNNVDMSTSVNR